MEYKNKNNKICKRFSEFSYFKFSIRNFGYFEDIVLNLIVVILLVLLKIIGNIYFARIMYRVLS